MGLKLPKGGLSEREAFRTLDEDRNIRLNNFLLFYYLFNLVMVITILLILLLLT
jgi:hypothetical protein